jgi:hypothetical protein
MTLLDRMAPHRNAVLWWEFSCLLHDLGKLSSQWLNYRQTWHAKPNGYFEDPHDHNWLDRDPLLKEPRFAALREFFRESEPGIERSVHGHMHPAKDDRLAKLLKLADTADSIVDRNNPMLGCEQTADADPGRHVPVYRGNVFGHERAIVTGDLLDCSREGLYTALAAELPILDKSQPPFRRLFDLVKDRFSVGLSDTTRPNNDTTLWEHVFSVATIAKALYAQELLGSPPTAASFRLWGVGIDSLRVLSFAHKIGDILGRKEIVETIFNRIRDHVELVLAIGNEIYRDSSSVVFLVPDLDIGGDLEAEAERIALDESGGEFLPQLFITPSTRTLTTVVTCLQESRERRHTPVRGGAALIFRFTPSAKPVCPVCRLRPVEDEENKLICHKCGGRRRGHTQTFSIEEECGHTPLISEIAGSHKRAALIVARFALDEWLDGSLVRTTFVTQPDAIRRTVEDAIPNIADLKLAGDDRRAWFQNRGANGYSQMVAEVAGCFAMQPEYADALFAYGRALKGEDQLSLNRDFAWRGGDVASDWKQKLQDARAEADLGTMSDSEVLANVLCSKTPTPSTILDVWHTTAGFFKAAVVDLAGIEGLEPQDRAYIDIEGDQFPHLGDHGAVEISLAGARFDAVYEKDHRRFWLAGTPAADQNWTGATVQVRWEGNAATARVLRADKKPRAYSPYRVILSSPDLLLLLVPAGKAIEVTRAIYARYLRDFAKVVGRLSLSIGNIFFADHLPMYSVLDAGRRLERSFLRLQGHGGWTRAEMADIPVDPRNLKLGDGQDDWHHPYAVTVRDLPDRPSYFKTLRGPVVRRQELQPHDEILIRPNFYDYEFLGASADRFRISLDPKWDEPGVVPIDAIPALTARGGNSGPILLGNLVTAICDLWDRLSEWGLSDAGARNLEHLLADRAGRWPAADLNRLAADLLFRYPVLAADDAARAKLAASIERGWFFRCLDIHLRILKLPLEPKHGGERAPSV